MYSKKTRMELKITFKKIIFSTAFLWNICTKFVKTDNILQLFQFCKVKWKIQRNMIDGYDAQKISYTEKRKHW